LCRDAGKKIAGIAEQLPKETKLVALGSEKLGQVEFHEEGYMKDSEVLVDEEQALFKAITREMSTAELLMGGFSFSSMKAVWSSSSKGNLKAEGKPMYQDAFSLITPDGKVLRTWLFEDFSKLPSLEEIIAACKQCQQRAVQKTQ